MFNAPNADQPSGRARYGQLPEAGSSRAFRNQRIRNNVAWRSTLDLPSAMDFDRFSVSMLILREDAPQLSEADAADLQDAHMAHLADLHDAGYLLAAGPLLDDRFRGFSILSVSPEKALELANSDPAVLAGKFEAKVMPWMVPAGAMDFSSTVFPRSMAEVE
jgi:uncharacterized protein YciI